MDYYHIAHVAEIHIHKWTRSGCYFHVFGNKRWLTINRFNIYMNTSHYSKTERIYRDFHIFLIHSNGIAGETNMNLFLFFCVFALILFWRNHHCMNVDWTVSVSKTNINSVAFIFGWRNGWGYEGRNVFTINIDMVRPRKPNTKWTLEIVSVCSAIRVGKKKKKINK